MVERARYRKSPIFFSHLINDFLTGLGYNNWVLVQLLLWVCHDCFSLVFFKKVAVLMVLNASEIVKNKKLKRSIRSTGKR